ncbi:MAG: Fic family protein [Rickettsiales bacterium]|nr:Fic family protein [Rickettsiales bacterium]
MDVLQTPLSADYIITYTLNQYAQATQRSAWLLQSIDFFKSVTGWIGSVHQGLYETYIKDHHPLLRYQATKPSIVSGSIHSKQELDGCIAAREYAQKIAGSGAALTLEHLYSICRLSAGYQQDDTRSMLAKTQMLVFNAQEVVTYRGAKPEDYALCLERLLEIINQPLPELHPLLHASMVFLLICTIHPFVDANGRTARVIAGYILYKNGYDLVHPSLEQFYAWDRGNYLNALLSYSDSFYTPSHIGQWNHYFLQSIFHAYRIHFAAKIAAKCGEWKQRLWKANIPQTPNIIVAPGLIQFTLQPMHAKQYGTARHVWPLYTQQGDILAYNICFGVAPKIYQLFQYADDGNWYPSAPQYQQLLPLYTRYPHQLVDAVELVVCVGEELVDALAPLLTDKKIVPLTWAASTAPQDSDWQRYIALGQRFHVVATDKKSLSIAAKLAQYLRPLDAQVHIIDMSSEQAPLLNMHDFVLQLIGKISQGADHKRQYKR